MKNTSLLCLIIFLLAGCASTKIPGAGDSALTELMAVLENAQPASYESTRKQVVDTFSALEQQQAALMGSPAARAKRIIATAGVILGVGGTISSFIIKDEDTKASIAQASGAVGAAAGIIGLIPIGSGSETAEMVNGYLGAELDAFQERWPENGELTEVEFAQFIGDSKRMIDTVELLGK